MLITLYCQGIVQAKCQELVDHAKMADLEEGQNGVL